MLGADVETAGVWDPLNFAKDGEAALYRRRCTEIKHGRVAQLAVIGFVMGDLYTFPGYLAKFSTEVKFSDVPAGLGAISAVPPLGWAQILLFAGLMETMTFKQDPSKDAGDIAPWSWWVRYDDAELKKTKLTSELKNGRLAMCAIMGMMVQEMVTGQTLVTQISSGNINPFQAVV
jgi:light-harvesting complex I chlorophyll a/b binding protein 1